MESVMTEQPSATKDETEMTTRDISNSPSVSSSESPKPSRMTPVRPSSSAADSAPAKRARLDAIMNGLHAQSSKAKDDRNASSSPPLQFSTENTPVVGALLKREPVEIICHVNSGCLSTSSTSDAQDDSGITMDDSHDEGSALIRLLQEQHQQQQKSAKHDDENGEGSNGEEDYDLSSFLLAGAHAGVDSTDTSFDFADPFVNEPPIFSPSVSTIRKNTRRSKPEKIAEKGCTRVNRDPNAPRQVISAYLCFVGEMRMKRNNGDLQCNGGEFGQLLKTEWTKLPDKTRYEMQHEEDKRRYEAELAAWARSERRPVPGRKAYSFYVLEHFDRIKSEHDHLPEEDIIMLVFKSWRDMSDKSKYFQMQQRDKERYRNEMKIYTARVAPPQNGAQPGQVTITTKKVGSILSSLMAPKEEEFTAALWDMGGSIALDD